MTIITKYFNKRNRSLDKNSNLFRPETGSLSPQYLAIRELKTIYFLVNEFYKSNLKERKIKVLDLGCGDKFLKNIIEETGNIYIGVDVDQLDFEKDKFKIENNYFDLIISLAVIEHLENPTIFLNEAFRVLKPDGYLYLTTPNWNYSYHDFYNDFTHKKPYTPRSIQEILEIFRFENVKTFPGLRCKSKWWYVGKYRFQKARYLFPFTNELKYIPSFLKGKARSIIAIGQKKIN